LRPHESSRPHTLTVMSLLSTSREIVCLHVLSANICFLFIHSFSLSRCYVLSYKFVSMYKPKFTMTLPDVIVLNDVCFSNLLAYS